jgi:hypothetical protein
MLEQVIGGIYSFESLKHVTGSYLYLDPILFWECSIQLTVKSFLGPRNS